MRPPEFTGGNLVPQTEHEALWPIPASMRPPEFTGGNMTDRKKLAAALVSLQ